MQNSNKAIIVLAGGHAGSTAYATVQELQKRGKYDIHFIGGKSSLEGKRSRTFAQFGLKNLGVNIHNIVSGRLQTKFTIWTIPSLLKVPIGFLHAMVILIRLNPSVIVSFGGYAGFPVVFCGWLLGIPVILHEQTSVAGRANRISSFFASKIGLARESSKKYFPKEKSVVVGNPIPREVLNVKVKTKISSPPHLLITGGVSGSRAINEVVYQIIDYLVKNFCVVHQTGDLDYQRFLDLKTKKLISNYRYKVFDIVDPKIWGRYVDWADIFLARSGANFVYQLLIVKKPAILVPLPISYLDEQVENAKYARNFGIARVIRQGDFNPQTLISNLEDVVKNWDKIVSNVKDKKSLDIDASQRFVSLILSFL
jgi:UDP-N-acetylglucosamine--N-acetylmuramyl-(pentapeptide) pyrophosphoryl-undecaprenol N-acetylglucosamine transferase